MRYEAPPAFRITVLDLRFSDTLLVEDCSNLADVFRVLGSEAVQCPNEVRDLLCQRLPTKVGEANIRYFGSKEVQLSARAPTREETRAFLEAALDWSTKLAERTDAAIAWDVVAGFQEALEDLQEAQV